MKRRTLAAHIVVLGMAVLVVAYAFGCGTGRPPSSGDNPTGLAPLAPLASGPCSLEGQTRPCHRLISEHAGIVTCSYGTQQCTGGTWTTCGGPSESVASFPMGAKTMALSVQGLPPLKVVRLPSATAPAAASPRVASSPLQSGAASQVTQ